MGRMVDLIPWRRLAPGNEKVANEKGKEISKSHQIKKSSNV